MGHDTSIFEFGLPSGTSLGLPVCACLLMKAPDCEHGGGDAVRPYTPISHDGIVGKFQIILKRYQEWGDPNYWHSYRPPGAVSNYIFGLKIGDLVEFKHIVKNVKLPYINNGVKGFQGV